MIITLKESLSHAGLSRTNKASDKKFHFLNFNQVFCLQVLLNNIHLHHINIERTLK